MRSAEDHLTAFRRESWGPPEHARRACTALYHDDRSEFSRRLRAAWEAQDFAGFILHAQVRAQEARLDRKTARRLWRQLIRAGRCAEALELLRDPGIGAEAEAAEDWRDIAQACAGCGALRDGKKAIRRARELGLTDAEAQALAGDLQLAARLRGHSERLRTFAEIAPLAEVCLRLGWPAGALEALTHLFAQGGQVVGDDRWTLLELIAGAHPAITAGAGVELLSSLGATFTRKGDRAALDHARRRLLEDPAAEAAAPPAAPRRLGYAIAMILAGGGRLDAATAMLDRLCADPPAHPQLRLELARLSGLQMAQEVRLQSSRQGPPKVVDLFPFGGELDLLELKLTEMGPWVDHFVIIEARQTFTGLDKSLHLQAARTRFAPWLDKIRHVVVDAFPAHLTSAWAREFHQRDSGMAAIGELCGPEDLVLITDVDEIIRPEALDGFEREYASLGVETFRYFYNYRLSVEARGQKRNPGVWKAKYFLRHGPSYARLILPQKGAPVVWDAGWHFTSVGGPQRILDKLKSYSHQEVVVPEELELAARLEGVRRGRDEPGWERWTLDGRFPAWLLQNRERLGELIL